ncbi:MAG: zinc ABC transporter substrate-binding protein [Clostridiaceae bacterium]
MKKIGLILTALVLSAAFAVGCAPKTGNIEENNGKIKVSTSINPVDQLVNLIGKDRVETSRMVPAGSEPHDFEPTIKDMGLLTETSLLFINGLGMETWVDKAVENSGNKNLKIVDLSTGVDLIPIEGQENENDPHIWLSLDALVIMAESVEKELSVVSPEDEAYFKENLEAFKTEATAMKVEYEEKFKPFKGKAFVTGHAAFGYLTRELGLVQKAVEGPFQEGEPTPKSLEELISFVKNEGIKTIFLEEQSSPKVSETLATETGSQTVVINPLESDGELLPTLKETYDKILASFN